MSLKSRIFGALCAGTAIAMLPTAAVAQDPPSLAERFQIGNDPVAQCSAQLDRKDQVAKGIFERAYNVICRDARLPIGRLYVLRDREGDPAKRLASARRSLSDCSEAAVLSVSDLGSVVQRVCRNSELQTKHAIFEFQKGRELYVAEGLSGYEAALRLALRTLVLDRQVEGAVPLASAGGDDPAAFARVIAGTLDPFESRSEGYRSNAGGRYLEAAEYFGSVREQLAGTGLSPEEITLNEALQQSNLGNYVAADRLLAEAAQIASDPLEGRLYRNFLALHFINQGRLNEAVSEAQRALADTGSGGMVGTPVIDETLSRRLDSENAFVQTLSGTDPPPLTREERITILDAQAAHIAGTALRLAGRVDEARASIAPALQAVEAVRAGRVASVYWLRSQMLAELAAIDEARGDLTSAERRLREAVRLMELEHPQTNAAWASQLSLAGLLARSGQEQSAYEVFRRVVDEASAAGESEALRNGLGPYFTLLENRAKANPAVVDEFFRAGQAMVTLGVARSQFEFARILAAGGDQAAALYRSVTQVSRDINKLRIEKARRANAANEDLGDEAAIAELDARIAALEKQQILLQAQLNSSTRYQVTTSQPLSLKELQDVLAPDEVYYKVFFVDGQSHGLTVTSNKARIVPLEMTEAQANSAAARLRATLGREIDGVTYVIPFDVETAHALYTGLIQPIEGELKSSTHLIFEPAGALLSLPLTMLVSEPAGVANYIARSSAPDGDPYDFSGVSWLGRSVAMSTTVSPRTLHLFRTSAPRSASQNYLGLGENLEPTVIRQAVLSPSGAGICSLPEAAWEEPISAQELRLAQAELGGASEILTGGQFTDTAIKSMENLDDYRILHFATHGIMTPPGAECLPQPALLTSFGEGQSDGLLSFQEIFSLSINADLVLLSACDTGAGASQEVTRRAIGELTGGGYALDGLVRSFMGAGARSVIASHWPIPEEPIDATTELIGTFFGSGTGKSIATALQSAQARMMDNPLTSHPFYWAAFAIIGDGAQPLNRSN